MEKFNDQFTPEDVEIASALTDDELRARIAMYQNILESRKPVNMVSIDWEGSVQDIRKRNLSVMLERYRKNRIPVSLHAINVDAQDIDTILEEFLNLTMISRIVYGLSTILDSSVMEYWDIYHNLKRKIDTGNYDFNDKEKFLMQLIIEYNHWLNQKANKEEQ